MAEYDALSLSIAGTGKCVWSIRAWGASKIKNANIIVKVLWWAEKHRGYRAHTRVNALRLTKKKKVIISHKLAS